MTTTIDKYKRLPKVFISSTIKGVKRGDPGLEPYRQKLHKMITDEFKWDCICSGESDQYFWGPSLAACLNNVENSDLYIGIFWRRYGSIVIPHEISMTEFEFYRARNLRKPMRIYIIRDESNYREEQLKLFLDLTMSDPEIATYACFCDLSQLEEKVRIDLELFEKAFDSEEEIDKFVPPYYIDESLKMLDLLPSELIILKEPPLTKASFDKEFVLKKLKDMETNYSEYKFDGVLQNGWDVLNVLKLTPPGKYKEFRTLWARFLRLWSGACNWFGYIEGSMGSVWASKSLLEIYRILEDWSLFNSWVGGVSSTLYTLAGIKEAKTHGVGGKWQKEFRKENMHLLKHALSCCNYAFSKSGTISGGLLSVRGNIHRELRNFKFAIADFQLAINIGGSEEYHASLLGDLGLTQIIKGDYRNGMRNLERGAKMCDRFKSPWKVRILKRFGEGLIVMQEWEEAEKEIKRVIHLGKQRKLGHQVITAISDLQIIKGKKERKLFNLS